MLLLGRAASSLLQPFGDGDRWRALRDIQIGATWQRGDDWCRKDGGSVKRTHKRCGPPFRRRQTIHSHGEEIQEQHKVNVVPRIDQAASEWRALSHHSRRRAADP